jgi:hypothetical protein
MLFNPAILGRTLTVALSVSYVEQARSGPGPRRSLSSAQSYEVMPGFLPEMNLRGLKI